ncbi:hypothetical protein FRC04_000002 [Tulasnella sp. 424]|nr:hypothetical protein FRC04_000002 [Tulasnella sp. 424]KAG8981867.1 hypothetical protein FRC05_000009 [Tulasnella sp. 425]
MDRRSPPPGQEHRPLLVPSSETHFSSNTVTEALCNICVWVSRRIQALGIRGVAITLVVSALTNFLIFSGEVTIRHKSAHDPQAVSHQTHLETDLVTADWGRVTGPVADGRIVVTGGGGNIGKHTIRRLLASSTPVTVIDKIFHQDELEDIYSDIPQARDLLRVKLGDIRDTAAMKEIMTSDVVGVIHLAAVSRVLWCLENQDDCWDVNERGTEVVLEALADLNRSDKGKRWFVLASSREVYGDAKVFPVEENSEKLPANVYGESKLRAEKVVKRFLEQVKNDKSAGSLYTIALRLSNVYGGAFDHVERLIPSIVTQALSHQVIQIVGGQQHFDLIHIDDVVDAFLLAVQQLSHRRNKWSFKSPRTFFDAFNVASGSSAPVDDLIDKIVRYTRSKSPIQYIPADNRFPNVYRGSTDKSWSELGFRAAVSVEEGVLRLVKLYLQRTERVLQKKIGLECGASAASIKANTELHKLNDCAAHINMDVRGELTILNPPDDPKDSRWHAVTTLPPYPVRTYITNNANGKPMLAVKEKDYFFGIRRSPAPAEGLVKVERISKHDISAGDHANWEMEVNAEEGTMKLILPGFPLQLKPPASPGGNFYLVPSELEIWPFRVTPICCQAPPPWPFFEDDPVAFQTEFQRTSLERPFLASPTKTFCDRLTRARRKVQRDLATLSLETLNEPRRRETPLAPRWVNANLPACSNSCDHPTVCVDTGDCQCVLASCPALQRFPFSSSANLPVLSYPPPQFNNNTSDNDPTFNPLLDMVKRSSWLNVLRPQASRFVGTKTPFPKLHVGELHPEESQWRKTNKDGQKLHLLRDAQCFSADTSMESAIAAMDVSQKDADFVFIPHWQARTYSDRMYRTYNYSRDTNPYFDPYRVVIPFTHDWGACLVFKWNVWDIRKTKGLDVSPYVRTTTAWTVMADHNSPCYRPHQDVVIPPRTCFSPKLFEAFGEMSKVKPARDRSVLVTFKGTRWGTGFLNRVKLMCQRVQDDKIADIPNRTFNTKTPLHTLWGTTGDYTYTGLLNDTIFCPQPAGTTGWATRLVDSIYAGCIPVLIGESSHQPFYDMIDYSKISIRITAADINRIEEILVTRYTLADVERMQANIMLVRDAFVYPLDSASSADVREKMLDQRGPLWFALHSTRMRMLTKWPMDDVYDRP